MAQFYLTPNAKKSLRNIGIYTKNNWGSDQYKKYLKSFYDCFDNLVQSPLIGKQRDEIYKDLRSYNNGKHVIFYMIKNNDIIIVDILHERMDVNTRL